MLGSRLYNKPVRRQAPNLKRILTRAKFVDNITDPTQTMVTKCEKPRCALCNDIRTTSSYFFHKSNKHFQIRTPMNCESKNLIYVLTCNGCNEYYIGMTGQTLRKRTNLHRAHINNPTTNSLFVCSHIANCSRGNGPKYSIIPFFKMKNDDLTERLIKEDHFISSFKPLLNR